MKDKIEQTAVIGLQFDTSMSKQKVGLAGVTAPKTVENWMVNHSHGWQAVKQAVKQFYLSTMMVMINIRLIFEGC